MERILNLRNRNWMWTKLLALLLCVLLVSSCGDYAALTAIDDNKKLADSLFNVRKDTLKKSFSVGCDSVYNIHYDRAVDSIKQLRIQGIKGLIDSGKE